MSSSTPGPGLPDPDSPPAVDHLGSEPRPGRTGIRRWGIAAAAAVGVATVAGAGAYAFASLSGGGPGAATAVPEDALAYVSLDLDPAAGQKVEAYRVLRKFPALRERLGEGDDLRRSLVEGILREAPCDDLSFEDDFEPWLGDRVAMAVAPGDAEPVPFFVVQVTDEDGAREGVDAVAACDADGDGADGEGDEVGVAFTDGYMILAEDDATAARLATDAGAAALADAEGYQRWVDEAGGAGIVTGYLAAGAPQALLEAAERDAAVSEELGDVEQLSELAEEFEGGAMAMRFDDGALEVEMATSTVPAEAGAGADSGLTDLPASTVVALGFGVGDDTVQQLLDRMATSAGQEEVDEMVADLEAETGLEVPEDLQTLLGDGVSLALDSSVDLSALGYAAVGGPLDLPLGVRISGDPDEIVPVLDRLLEAAGVAEQAVVETGDGVVAVGVSPAYVARLAEEGGLGDEDAFGAAMPDLEDSAGGLFVDFDRDGWLTEPLAGEPGTEDALANLEPLDGLGATGRVDGDVAHATLRLTTD